MANSFEAMKMATESLAKEVMRRATHNSVWLNAVPRGKYNLNTGLTQTTFTVEWSQPTDDTETWQNIQLSTGSPGTFGACADTYTDANLGFSERTFSPQKMNLRSPVVCSEDLLFEHIPAAYLSAYRDELVKRAKKSWENKIINEYAKLAGKVTVSGTGSAAAVATTTTIGEVETVALASSSVGLEQGHLKQVAIRLIENGATEGDSNGWITLESSGPVFPLVIGMEASEKIASAESGLREDLRFGEPNELLKRIGAARVLGNFRHIPVTMPLRFTYNSTEGKYERVNQYVESLATKGKKYEINPAWRSATHEAAIVLNPSVMTVEVVPSASYGLSFDAANYVGDWQWVVGGDRIGATAVGGDPQGKLGRHFAQYMAAFRPIRPEDGAVIIFKR